MKCSMDRSFSLHSQYTEKTEQHKYNLTIIMMGYNRGSSDPKVVLIVTVTMKSRNLNNMPSITQVNGRVQLLLLATISN